LQAQNAAQGSEVQLSAASQRSAASAAQCTESQSTAVQNSAGNSLNLRGKRNVNLNKEMRY
jgi:hypothetical protein